MLKTSRKMTSTPIQNGIRIMDKGNNNSKEVTLLTKICLKESMMMKGIWTLRRMWRLEWLKKHKLLASNDHQ